MIHSQFLNVIVDSGCAFVNYLAIKNLKLIIKLFDRNTIFNKSARVLFSGYFPK